VGLSGIRQNQRTRAGKGLFVTRVISGAAHLTARHTILVTLLVCCLPSIARVTLLPWLPIPAPSIHDEFSNLLAADTFLHGRLANPTPPSWQHFETFHELVRPTYASVYPPGIGLLLAASIYLFGHAWWGVAISVIVMNLAIVWMLRPWFPPVWCVLGGLLIGLQFGVMHYWVNGYWGGTLPAIGGSLVIGACGRLKKAPTWRTAALLAIGTALLILTRPYEGGVLVITAGCALLWSLRRSKYLATTIGYVAVTAFVIAGPALWLLSADNKAVTGSRTVLPHELYRQEYAVMPSFAWQPRQAPIEHNPILQQFFYQWEPDLEHASLWGTWAGLWPCIYDRLRAAGQFAPNLLYYLVAIASIPACLFRPMRFFGLCFFTALFANSLVNWLTAHYLAPVLGAMIAIHIYALRWVRAHFRRSAGNYMFASLIVLLALCFGVRFDTKMGIPWDKEWAYDRQDLIAKLSASPQRHLIFVRYAPTHDIIREWVYNGADIPDERVIWVRYISPDSDRAVAAAFPGRSNWLLDPDLDLHLHPYEQISHVH